MQKYQNHSLKKRGVRKKKVSKEETKSEQEIKNKTGSLGARRQEKKGFWKAKAKANLRGKKSEQAKARLARDASPAK